MKKILTFSLTLALCALFSFFGLTAPRPAAASAATFREDLTVVTDESQAAPYAIRANIGTIYKDGFVYGVVINISTGTDEQQTTIDVRIKLLGAEALPADPLTMPVLASGLAGNLPKGDEVTCGIRGNVSRYYIVVAEIKLSKDPEEAYQTFHSKVVHYAADGTVL